jgi:hypothetical protein
MDKSAHKLLRDRYQKSDKIMTSSEMDKSFHQLLRNIYQKSNKIITLSEIDDYISIGDYQHIHITITKFKTENLEKILDNIRNLEIEENIHKKRHIVRDLERIYDLDVSGWSIEKLIAEEDIIEAVLHIVKKYPNKRSFDNTQFLDICHLSGVKLENEYSIEDICKIKNIKDIERSGNYNVNIIHTPNEITIFKNNLANIKKDIEVLKLKKLNCSDINHENINLILENLTTIKRILNQYSEINIDPFEELFFETKLHYTRDIIIQKIDNYYPHIKNEIKNKSEKELFEIYKNKFTKLQNFDDLLNLDVLFDHKCCEEKLSQIKSVNNGFQNQLNNYLKQKNDYCNKHKGRSIKNININSLDNLIKETKQKIGEHSSIVSIDCLNNKAIKWIKYIVDHIDNLKLNTLYGITKEQQNNIYDVIQQDWEDKTKESDFCDIYNILVLISVCKSREFNFIKIHHDYDKLINLKIRYHNTNSDKHPDIKYNEIKIDISDRLLEILKENKIDIQAVPYHNLWSCYENLLNSMTKEYSDTVKKINMMTPYRCNGHKHVFSNKNCNCVRCAKGKDCQNSNSWVDNLIDFIEYNFGITPYQIKYCSKEQKKEIDDYIVKYKSSGTNQVSSICNAHSSFICNAHPYCNENSNCISVGLDTHNHISKYYEMKKRLYAIKDVLKLKLSEQENFTKKHLNHMNMKEFINKLQNHKSYTEVIKYIQSKSKSRDSPYKTMCQTVGLITNDEIQLYQSPGYYYGKDSDITKRLYYVYCKWYGSYLDNRIREIILNSEQLILIKDFTEDDINTMLEISALLIESIFTSDGCEKFLKMLGKNRNNYISNYETILSNLNYLYNTERKWLIEQITLLCDNKKYSKNMLGVLNIVKLRKIYNSLNILNEEGLLS